MNTTYRSYQITSANGVFAISRGDSGVIDHAESLQAAKDVIDSWVDAR